MEAMDEFGDLYVDDVKLVSLSHSNFRRFDGKKNDADDLFDVSDDEVELKDDQCSILCGRVREIDGFDGPRLLEENPGASNEENDRSPTAGRIEKIVVDNNEGGNLCSLSENSDSEDDFHIVLNEDNMVFSQSMRVFSSTNGRRLTSDDEDGDDNMVIHMGEKILRKDEKWVEDNEVCVERGRVTKTGVSNQYYNSHNSLQFKVSRASRHSASWNQIEQEVKTSNASERRIPSVGTLLFDTIGRKFSLPRNKTIFDIGIESFEKKPWRYPGVDITNFFNFGMDEESWKDYCTQLDQIRKQAPMNTRIPVYELALGSANSEGVEGSDLHKHPLHVQPKGRAIQVEAGTAERIPSVDLRRPRVRDSDAVIQVILQEEVAECKTCKESDQSSNVFMQNAGPGKRDFEMESELLDHTHVCDDPNHSSLKPEYTMGARPSTVPSFPAPVKSLHAAAASCKESEIWPSERCSAENSVDDNEGLEQHMSHASDEHKQSESSAMALDIIMENSGNSDKTCSRLESSPSQNGSYFSDHTNDGSRSDHPEKWSVGSGSEVSNDVEVVNPGRMLYTSSSDQLVENPRAFQHHQYNALKSNDFKLESDRSREYQTFHQEDIRKSGVRTRVQKKISLEDGVSTLTHNNSKDDVIGCGTLEEKAEFHSFDGKPNLTYYRDREAYDKYRSRRPLERYRRRDAYMNDISSKMDALHGKNLDPSPRENVLISDSMIQDPVARKDAEKKHCKSWFLRRGSGSVNGRDCFIDEDSCRSRLGYFCTDHKEMHEYLNHGSKSWINVHSTNNNSISRKSYRQELMAERYQRHMGDADQSIEVKAVNKKYGHDSDMHDSLRDWEVDQATHRHPYNRHLFDPKEMHRLLGKSVWENQRADYMQHMLESGEIIVGCCKETVFSGLGYRKHREEDSVIRRMKEHYHLPKLRARKAVNDHLDTRDHGFCHGSVSSENTRNGWFSENFYYGDRESTSEYYDLDNQYGMDPSYGHEKYIYGSRDVKYQHSNWRRVSSNSRLQNYNDRLCCGRESELDLDVHSFSNMVDWNEDYENAPTSRRGSVNLQKKDWEEKSARRCLKSEDLIHSTPFKEQRVLRKYNDLYTGGEIPSTNSKTEDKPLSNINSRTDRGKPLNMDNSCCYSNYMPLDKLSVIHHLEVLGPSEDSVSVKHSKRKVVIMGEERLPKKSDGISGIYCCRSRYKEFDDLHHENVMHGTKPLLAYDSKRILETMEKMEKRRDRFKEPILPKKESDKTPVPLAGETTENTEGKQRPIRKRKWCGS